MAVQATNYDGSKTYNLVEEADLSKILGKVTKIQYVTKVFKLTNASGFMNLYTKEQIMELLGLSGPIDKFNEKITFHVINGDWSSQNMYINGMAFDPAANSMVIHYDNGIASGSCRLNFLIIYSEEGEVQ